MDGFEVNKILGAILGTALLVIGISNVANAIYDVEPLKKDAYPVEVAASGAAGGATAAAAAPIDLGTALATADVKKGEQIARSKCTACHTLDKGQPPATGPNLYGVVGGPVIRTDEGFNYSSAMQKFGGNWTYERLWAFIGNPRDTVPGTAMTFVGLPKEGERADVIAWLRANADSPVPLPEAKKAEAAPAPAPGEPPAASSTATAAAAPEGNAPATSGTAPTPAGAPAPSPAATVPAAATPAATP